VAFHKSGAGNIRGTLATFQFRFFISYTNFTVYKNSQNDKFTFLHGCETWSLILREEHTLRLFENMVLRRILVFRRKKQEEERMEKTTY
jgi:hypothetical protein